MKPYWIYFILGPLCMIIEVVGEVLLPKFLAQIINQGIGSAAQAGQGSGYIMAISAAMVGTAVLMLLGGVGGAYFGAKASVNFSADLRQDVYRKVQKFSFSNIDKFSTGSLVTRLTNDITQIQNFVNMLLRLCLRASRNVNRRGDYGGDIESKIGDDSCSYGSHHFVDPVCNYS